MAGYISMNISSALCRSTHVVLHNGLTRFFTSGNLHSSTSASLSHLFPFSKNFHASLTLPHHVSYQHLEHELAIDKFSMWLQQCTYVARGYFCRMILLAPFLTPAMDPLASYPCPRRYSQFSPSSCSFSRIVEATAPPVNSRCCSLKPRKLLLEPATDPRRFNRVDNHTRFLYFFFCSKYTQERITI